MPIKKEHIDSYLDNPKRILVGGVVVGIGGFLLYKLGKKLIADLQKGNTENSADDSPEVRQAMTLRSAMNPSGISWMMSMDGTNTTVILETATQIKKLDDVSSAYRKLYSSDLLADLQSELSTSDYQKFLTQVSSNAGKKGGAAPVKFVQKNQLVVAKAEIFLRTSPDASYHGAIYEVGDTKNIIRKAKIGEFLGYATGNQHFDTKNNVKFIEVAYLMKKDGLPASLKPYAGKKFSYWVSSGSTYVDIFPFYKNMFDQYPNTQTEAAYKKPLDFYSKGVSGIVISPVITTKSAFVLDDKMKPLVQVQSSTLLGEYIMSLNTGKERFIKFRTVDNTERWIKANAVIIKNS